MATMTATELQPIDFIASGAGHHMIPAPLQSHEPPAEALPTSNAAGAPTIAALAKTRAIIVIAQLSGLALFSSFCNGVIVVGLPAMIETLGLDDGLLLWPTSVFYLTAGSCLLMAGSIADVAGTKRVNLVGSFMGAATALACGFAQTGGQLIAFRALQGISYAIITPSAISIISTSVEDGQPRNIGFASLGVASTLGFSLGLVLGGVFIDHTGWRPAFYFAGATSLALSVVGIWALPPSARPRHERSIWKRLASEIDWLGTILASTGLASLSYVLATLSADAHNIRQTSNIALLAISAASIPGFIVWMHYQVKNNRIALIPNSLWRRSAFTSICIMAIFTTAVTNCMELFSSLFFQEVQGFSAFGASLRILPSLIAGGLMNLSTGIFVNRMPVKWVVLVSSALSAGAALLMALIQPEWPYWYAAFFAQMLAPLSTHILFTVGLLFVSDVFPAHMQGLSGAVFNTCAQVGTAIGLTVTSVISASVTASSREPDKASPGALMEGYRAVFWTMFSWMVVVCLVSGLGLRRVGGVGVKRD